MRYCDIEHNPTNVPIPSWLVYSYQYELQSTWATQYELTIWGCVWKIARFLFFLFYFASLASRFCIRNRNIIVEKFHSVNNDVPTL